MGAAWRRPAFGRHDRPGSDKTDVQEGRQEVRQYHCVITKRAEGWVLGKFNNSPTCSQQRKYNQASELSLRALADFARAWQSQHRLHGTFVIQN